MLYLYVWSFLQIIFESLPISSSGNVMLWTEYIARYTHWFEVLPISKNIDFLVHGPTLLIIIIFFRKQLQELFRICMNDFVYGKRFILFVLCADSITCFWFLCFARYKVVIPLWIGFLITAFCLFSLTFIKKFIKHDVLSVDSLQASNRQWSVYNGLLLGFLQGIALLPGISRFAITFVGALWLRFSARNALFISFLLQMPLIGAAFIKGLWGVLYTDSQLLGNYYFFIAVITVATGLSYFLFTLVARSAYHHKLHLFAWYMVGIAGGAWYLGL